MKKEKIFEAVAMILIIAVLGSAFYYYLAAQKEKSDSFEADKIFIKAALKRGETYNTEIGIKNLADENDFEISAKNPNGWLKTGGDEFHLGSGKNIYLNVTLDSENLEPGVYFSAMSVKNNFEEKEIPVVMEIQTRESFFAVSVDSNSEEKEIGRKEKMVNVINFFSLRDSGSHDVEMNYKILDLNGNEYPVGKETISAGPKSSVTRTVSVPKEIKSGTHVFSVILNYKNSTAASSYVFKIREGKISLENMNPNLIQISILILLLLIIGIIIYILIERDVLISKLKVQQKSELKFYSGEMDKKEKNFLKNAKSEKEKTRVIRQFSDAKTKIIKRVKELHKKQKMELSRLRSKKDQKYLENKIKQWKGKVYPQALKSVEINSELKRKLGILQEAYSEGYISKDSYSKGKTRIEGKIKRKSL